MASSQMKDRLKLLDGGNQPLDFKSELRRARTEASVKQADLAIELGVSRQTVVAYEAGTVVPIRAIVIAVAALTGYSLSKLLEAWEPAWDEFSSTDKRRGPGQKGRKTLGGYRHLHVVGSDQSPSTLIDEHELAAIRLTQTSHLATTNDEQLA